MTQDFNQAKLSDLGFIDALAMLSLEWCVPFHDKIGVWPVPSVGLRATAAGAVEEVILRENVEPPGVLISDLRKEFVERLDAQLGSGSAGSVFEWYENIVRFGTSADRYWFHYRMTIRQWFRRLNNQGTDEVGFDAALGAFVDAWKGFLNRTRGAEIEIEAAAAKPLSEWDERIYRAREYVQRSQTPGRDGIDPVDLAISCLFSKEFTNFWSCNVIALPPEVLGRLGAYARSCEGCPAGLPSPRDI